MPSNTLPTLLPRPVPPSASAELQRLSKHVIATINAHDLAYSKPPCRELLSHVARDFAGQMDNYPGILDLAHTRTILYERGTQEPTAKFLVDDISVAVDEGETAGKTFLSLAIRGLSIDVQLRGSLELSWRLEGERWMLWRYHGMRGMHDGISAGWN